MWVGQGKVASHNLKSGMTACVCILLVENGQSLANMFVCFKCFCLILDVTELCLIHIAVATAYDNAFFGLGTGPIAITNVACTGTEDALINCTFVYQNFQCAHSEDAAVKCFPNG